MFCRLAHTTRPWPDSGCPATASGTDTTDAVALHDQDDSASHAHTAAQAVPPVGDGLDCQHAWVPQPSSMLLPSQLPSHVHDHVDVILLAELVNLLLQHGGLFEALVLHRLVHPAAQLQRLLA